MRVTCWRACLGAALWAGTVQAQVPPAAEAPVPAAETLAAAEPALTAESGPAPAPDAAAATEAAAIAACTDGCTLPIFPFSASTAALYWATLTMA